MSVGWRLRIEHTTSVTYAGPVLTSFNEARMTPLTLPTQVTLESRVTAGPGVPVWTYNDYWGTYVSVFDLPEPHDAAGRRHRQPFVIDQRHVEIPTRYLGWNPVGLYARDDDRLDRRPTQIGSLA